MACPAIAGAGVLARQYFVDGFYPTGAAVALDGFSPTGALIKAILLNAAVDMTGIAGFPTDQEGWGRLLADNALFFQGDARDLVVDDVWNAVGLTTGQASAIGLNVISSTEPLKITLVWTDPPPAPGAHVVLVNDLDLEVIAPDGTLYLGNDFAGGQSTTGGAPDSRNNVEQVLITAPSAGIWTARVRGTAINISTQGYGLVCTGDLSQAPAPLTLAVSAPMLVAPATPTTITAELNPGDDQLVGTTPTLFYRNGSGAFTPITMSSTTANVFQANLPVAFCGDVFEYYVQAQGISTGLVADPSAAALSPLIIEVGQDQNLVTDNLEFDLGWTIGAAGDTAVRGIWERVDPVGSLAQPEDDHTTVGTLCFVTQQHIFGTLDSTDDVDGPGGGVAGFTTLLSPVYDLSLAPEARIGYWRWFYSQGGLPDDTLTVSVSSDGGANWAVIETVGTSGTPQTRGGWVPNSFRVADFVATTSTVQLRFVVRDGGFETIVEAGIDDVTVDNRVCVNVLCKGDANGDMLVNFSDITAILGNWLATSVPGSGSLGDANHNGIVNFDDVLMVLARWLQPCN